jgi:hypothetical protein
VPERLGRMMRWVRHPASRFIRIPVSQLLVLGGVFSILPGLDIEDTSPCDRKAQIASIMNSLRGRRGR